MLPQLHLIRRVETEWSDAHHHKVPVTVMWNSNLAAGFEPETTRAIERWENEGGEIPDQPRQLTACQLP